jgi:hypothetical protein
VTEQADKEFLSSFRRSRKVVIGRCRGRVSLQVQIDPDSEYTGIGNVGRFEVR